MSFPVSEKVFSILKKVLFDKYNFEYSAFLQEKESEDYEASVFSLNQLSIKMRTAKVTPKKNGQFVTLWKRDGDGVTQPHDYEDPVDIFIVNVKKAELLGQFVFPKNILSQRKIVSKKGIGGKRGIRVYPPWDIPKSTQAGKTQKWQKEWFLDLSNASNLDIQRAKQLYSEYI